jgi:hypothetical protein
MATETTTRFAFVDDITPNRATVRALAEDEQALIEQFADRDDGQIIPVTSTVTLGERIWRPTQA